MSNYIKVLPAVSTPIGATLMKTGMTTSYRTGDDGDLERGRATDFFTLPSNNPLGNTNRFTSELGTQTYTNNILIDWSTYNGSNVLGYYYGEINGTNRTWNNAIDWGLALSIGSFTSGWRLVNVSELNNLINWEAAYALHYPPLNSFGFITAGFWSSTTWRSLTTHAMRILNSEHTLSPIVKTNTLRCIACRTFTVTGTTLT
jgi:hypothetical protein